VQTTLPLFHTLGLAKRHLDGDLFMQVVDMLESKYAETINWNIQSPSEGTPLVHVAIYCLPFFRRVVERGGDVNVRSSDGSTTLHALFSQVPANTETSLAIAELVYEKGGAWQINAA